MRTPRLGGGLLLAALLLPGPGPAGPADNLVAAARAAAQADRNAEAAALFAEAMAIDPAIRAAILREHADQLVYAGSPALAVPLFVEVIARVPSEDERRRAERGLALALLWDGEAERAAVAWEAILARDPGDADARANLARALAGSARHAARADRNAAAAALFARAVETDPPQRAVFLREWADQLTYAGQPARAVALYDEALAGDLEADAARAARRGRALALLWAHRDAEAAAAWERVVAEAPGDADARANLALALEGAAGAALRADRNAEAADLLARAIAAEPSRRAALAATLAEQLTYAGRAADAVLAYRDALAQPDLDDASRARLLAGLGLALAWSDRPLEAVAAYDAALALDPGAVETLANRARALGWLDRNAEALAGYEAALAGNPAHRGARLGAAEQEGYLGLQRRALDRLATLLAEAPDDVEALRLAARSALWLGRPDRARPLARHLLAVEPGDPDALAVLADIARELAPRSAAWASSAEESDGTRVSEAGARHVVRIDDGLTTLEATLGRTAFQGGAVDPFALHRLGLFANRRLGDDMAASAALAWSQVEGSGDDRLGYEAAWTWWPTDRVRLDVIGSRRGFEDGRSVLAGVSMDSLALSLDVQPTRELTLTARAAAGEISDGNSRRFAELELRHEPRAAPGLAVGLRVAHLGFARPDLDTGYFNPESLASAEASVALELDPAPRWDLGLTAALGTERDGDGASPTGRLGLDGAFEIRDGLALSAGLEAQDTRLGSDGGYRRTGVHAGLEIRW